MLDDITPLRDAHDGVSTRLFSPNTAIRTKLHFGALYGVKRGTSFSLTFGIGGGITTVEGDEGVHLFEHLDVGENPPNGAIVYYWLDEAAPVALTFRDAAGSEIVTLRSDDAALPAARRPGRRRGLNRYVWDMKYPGPDKLDPVPGKAKPLASEKEGQAGPTVVPGEYQVALTAGSEAQAAKFTIVKDPRLGTTTEGYARQFALLKELTDSLSKLNAAVNRIRRIKRQLDALPDRLGGTHVELASAAMSFRERLDAIEGVLVDVHRASPRDVLRNPAGLNDTLVDLINTVAISDTAPTSQAGAVSHEIVGHVGAEVAKLDALVAADLGEINRLAASVAAVVG